MTDLIKVLMSIRNFRLAENGEFQFYHLSFSNSQATKDEYFLDDTLKSAIGEMGLTTYNLEDFAYVYSTLDDTFKEDNLRQDLVSFSITATERLKSFLKFLWFIKDNSVTYSQSVSTITKGMRSITIGSTNFEVLFNSKGTLEDVAFTRDELTVAANICTHFEQLVDRYQTKGKPKDSRRDKFSKWSEEDDTSDILDVHERDYNAQPLIERALSFVFAARATYLLHSKLSLYMTALEAIFVPDGGGELQQKLGERTAFYIEEKENRKEIFQILKNAYAVRSKYVHGDMLPEKYRDKETITQLCGQVDDIVRRTFIKVLMEDHKNFTAPIEEIKAYVGNIIFK